MDKPQYLLVINHLVANIISSVDEIRKQSQFANLKILAITDKPDFNKRYSNYISEATVIFCDFDDPADIKAKLSPFAESIVGVVCRGDRHIQYLRRIRKFLPEGVKAASEDALEKSTNKRLMRQSFRAYPEITPGYIYLKDSLTATLDSAEKKLGYPLIIKPANLFSSLLIQVCQNRAEFETAVEKTFQSIQKIYNLKDIREKPQIIAEQYLTGDFYSIDAYVMGKGEIYFCPAVAYVPAKQIGVDDFFLYKRFVPTILDESQAGDANRALSKALDSVGLTYSSVHAELVLTKDGWKMIEIGPRLGRFRHSLYKLAYGIDHSLNDVKIHLGIKPDIPSVLLKACAAYSIYPPKEGRLSKVHGLGFLENLSQLYHLRRYIEDKGECVYAKHGGGPILEFVISSADISGFNELMAEVEAKVYADID